MTSERRSEVTPSAGARDTPGALAVPDIDLGGLFCEDTARQSAVHKAMRQACAEPGYFFAHGTPLDGADLDAAYAQARRFFYLKDSDPRKQACHAEANGGSRGWWPRGEEPAYVAGTVANLQSYDIAAEQVGSQTRNPWPDLDGFRQPVWGVHEGMRQIADALFPAFAQMLGLPPEQFQQYRGRQDASQMRLLHYAVGKTLVQADVGISAHTDFECFTLMHQTAGGLELRDVHGTWHRVPARPDRMLVIIGDMLERWTNGTLRATAHRVPLLPEERLSAVMFCAVEPQTVVAPLPSFVSVASPARYAPVTQGDHITAKVAAAMKNRKRSISGVLAF